MKQIDRICNMNAEELADEIKRIVVHMMISRIQRKEFDIEAWLESEVEE